MPAPILKERSPHSGGKATTPSAPLMPSPLAPWHTAHCWAKIFLPLTALGTTLRSILAMPRPGTLSPAWVAPFIQAIYANIACKSGVPAGKGEPFIERLKQPLMRSARLITLPARGASDGKNAEIPRKGEPWATVPPFRWQLLQFKSLPTFLGRRALVSVIKCMPRINCSALASAIKAANRGVEKSEDVGLSFTSFRTLTTCHALTATPWLPQLPRTKLRISASSPFDRLS